MDTNKIISSGEEQAVAAWTSYLNKLRIDKLISELQNQDENLNNTAKVMSQALKDVDKIIEKDRGGTKGIHGYLAEAAENGIENAKKLIIGEDANVKWLNDNGVWDFLRDDNEYIQMKFSVSGGTF